MSLDTVATALQQSGIATLVDGSRYVAMVVQSFHLLGLTFLLAIALAFNMRVLRFSLGSIPLDKLARALHLPFMLTLSVSVSAGILLFLPRAASYAAKDPFIWKMLFLLVAAAAQLLLLRKAFALPACSEATLPVRALSALTLVLWLATGVAGRTIGFV
jgi:hypothetical protein